MRILLTGAAGQVGKRLLPKLTQQGYSVRVLTRRSAPAQPSSDEVVIKELNPQTDFASLLANIDILIHLADGFNAYEHLPITAINNEASSRAQTTKRLTKAAAQKGIHLLYLSTIKTMCGTHADEILTEKTRPHPQSLYGTLKLNAEQYMLSAAQQYGSEAVVLRFPAVFGLDHGSMENLLQLLNSPLPVPFADLSQRRSLISANSLIHAVMAIIKQQTYKTGTYLVHDGALSIVDMTSMIRKGLGRPARRFRLPSPIWHRLEKLPALGSKVLRFTHSLELDDSHFRKTYNWHSQKTLPAALREWTKDK
ncbi:MAG: NAD-dependent epimerase/dehydratase family protein [bacterium]|nr:NAD-dependent epimerase/dehydratase family protein [bacterium]